MSVVQVRELEGRPHYVVPVVMLTAGSHAGTAGPVYYGPDVLRNSVPGWEGRPVVVYHPDLMGRMVSALSPDVFNRQKVGVLFHARFDGSRLLADAWIDAARVGKLHPGLKAAIDAGRVTEVSTGMWSDLADGTFVDSAGRTAAVALRVSPDHLALLPDRVGACSVAAGCGLLRNESWPGPLDPLAV